jgi:hypothetical protein
MSAMATLSPPARPGVGAPSSPARVRRVVDRPRAPAHLAEHLPHAAAIGAPPGSTRSSKSLVARAGRRPTAAQAVPTTGWAARRAAALARGARRRRAVCTPPRRRGRGEHGVPAAAGARACARRGPRERERSLRGEERDVGAERRGQLQQGVLAERARVERVERPQHRARVGAAATESSADRNPLVDLDGEAVRPTGRLGVGDGGAPGQVRLDRTQVGPPAVEGAPEPPTCTVTSSPSSRRWKSVSSWWWPPASRARMRRNRLTLACATSACGAAHQAPLRARGRPSSSEPSVAPSRVGGTPAAAQRTEAQPEPRHVDEPKTVIGMKVRMW